MFRFTYARNDKQHFWKETVYAPKDKTMTLALPVKGNLLPEKYGSHSSVQPSWQFAEERKE